jgi:hypothetical protein
MAAVLVLTAFLPVVPLPLVFAALLLAGCVLPVFMGGLSAFVDEVMPGNVQRGFAVDALAYNIAGIGAPAIVSAATVLLSPSGALLALAVVSVLGGLLLQTLPLTPRGGSAHPVALARGIAAAARHLVTHGPLARATSAGALVTLGGGAMPVVAVLLALSRGADASGGGWLLTGFAIGGVGGALLITVPAVTRRLAAFPARWVMAGGFALTGVFTLAAAFTPGFALTFVALLLAGLPDAPGVAAMLRIRQEESPESVRAQVFVVASGLRVATASMGAAAVGLLAGVAPAVLVALVAVPWILAAPILLVRAGPGSGAAAADPAPGT